MYGLNTFSILMFIWILYLSNKVSKYDKRERNIVLFIVSFFLFTFNFSRLMRNPSNLPVEFSSITYLVAPLIIIAQIKFLRVWAIYSSLMAGFFYYFTMMTVGGSVYQMYQYFDVYQSLYSHGSLLFMGLVLLFSETLPKNKSFTIIIGNLLIGAWAIYRKPFVSFNSRIFIYEIVDATHVYQINLPTVITLPLYYTLLGLLIYKSSHWIYGLNKHFYYKRRQKMQYIALKKVKQ